MSNEILKSKALFIFLLPLLFCINDRALGQALGDTIHMDNRGVLFLNNTYIPIVDASKEMDDNPQASHQMKLYNMNHYSALGIGFLGVNLALVPLYMIGSEPKKNAAVINCAYVGGGALLVALAVRLRRNAKRHAASAVKFYNDDIILRKSHGKS
jgi:hypothetical protein